MSAATFHEPPRDILLEHAGPRQSASVVPGRFLVKGFVPLGASMWVSAEAWTALSRRAADLPRP